MFFRRKKQETIETPAPEATNTPTINLAKERTISLSKDAEAVIKEFDLNGERLAVYGVWDHSGSMSQEYRNGTMQSFAERALAVALNFDDDGEIPSLYFDTQAHDVFNINLDNIDTAMAANKPKRMGTTDYVAAMHAVVRHYKASGSTHPAYVIFQTDGAPNDRRAAEKAICEYSNLPIYWQFVGLGNDRFDFLRKLDDLDASKRAVDNAGFFAVQSIDSASPQELFRNLVKEVPSWLKAIRAKGII